MEPASDTTPRTWSIALGAEQTAATWDPPTAGGTDICFICAHGAGGHMADRAVVGVTGALRERQIGTVRFNFLYRAKGSARPDPMPRLMACFEAVVDRVRTELNPRLLILGGRSMGGRAASMLAAARPTGDGLLLLAYPLHPPGQTTKLRDAHLSTIAMPVLCCNGTRDPFSERSLMERVVSGLGKNWRMHWIEGADHSFHVLKSSGRTDRDVLNEVAQASGEWVGGIR